MNLKSLKTEIRRLKERLRAAVRAAGSVPSDPADAQFALRRVGEELGAALRHFEAAEAASVAADSMRRAENAAASECGVTAAKTDLDDIIEWVAGEIQSRRPEGRYMIEESGDDGDWYGHRAGAVARITGGRYSSSLLVGGELGMIMLRKWRRSKRGGMVPLGAPGVARIAGGTRAEERARQRADQLRRKRAEAEHRKTLLTEVASAVLGKDRAERWITWERHWKAGRSDAGLRDTLEDLARESGIAEVRTVRERLDALERLFHEMPRSYTSDCYGHGGSAYDDARRAALRSAGDLLQLLRSWLDGDTPFPAGRLETAVAEIEAEGRGPADGRAEAG